MFLQILKIRFSLSVAYIFIVSMSRIIGQVDSSTISKHTDQSTAETQLEKVSNWEKTFSLGLNLSHTLNINAVAGAPKSGFGGSGNVAGSFNYVKENAKVTLLNDFSWTMALYRATAKSIIQNTSDILNLNHDVSWAFKKGGDWNVNLILNEESVIFNLYEENYLKDLSGMGRFQAFLNPFTISINPGIKYQPNKHLGISLSPYALQIRGVTDQTIADKDLYFTDVDDRIDANGSFKKTFIKTLGATTNIWYQLKVKKALILDYKLFLSSNYFEQIFKNGQIKGQFKSDLNLFKGLVLRHIANLKGNFSQKPLKPYYNQVILLAYNLSL